MQKTIYIPNPDIWKAMKASAGKQSISRYLRDLHEANVIKQKGILHREALSREQKAIVDGISDIKLFGGSRDNERSTHEDDQEHEQDHSDCQ